MFKISATGATVQVDGVAIPTNEPHLTEDAKFAKRCEGVKGLTVEKLNPAPDTGPTHKEE